MTSPIQNFIIQKEAEGKMNIRFDYVGVNPAFDTVMVLLVEQDYQPDKWILKPRESQIWTSGGWMKFYELDFYNVSFGKWWNEGNSSGAEDDTGNRKRIRKLYPPLGASTTSFGILYYAGQIDETNTSTTPEGLEFYAMAGIVGTVDNRPVVQLGAITHSNQIAGV